MGQQSSHRRVAKPSISRRAFLQGAAAVTAFSVLPRHVLGGAGFVAPSEKINVAIIGTGGQGIVNMKQLFQEKDCRIAALCDINPLSDYSMFYYGGTAGLKPALDLVTKQYGQACPTYHDYQQMLAKEDIDAVLLATPDHSHAAISLKVIAAGKHLYCEKPLCRTVYETRVVTEAARKAGVATQMGNYGHSSDDIRMVCEWIWDGAIGDVREVHAWTNTGANRWTHYQDRPEEHPPVPEGFDWKRWLGPADYRPYHPHYAPVRWRAWWQFGSGTIGDFACHHVDPAFWALKLDQASTFTVEGSSAGATKENCPAASLIYFDVPARAGMGPLRINWYEGGVMPPRPAQLLEGRRLGTNGIIYEGTRGAIMGGGWSREPRLVPITRMREYQQPAKTLARVPGHHRDWLNACKGQGTCSGNFDYSGPLSEFVLMGNIALRSEKKLNVDWKNLKITNDEAADRMIRPEFDDTAWMT